MNQDLSPGMLGKRFSGWVGVDLFFVLSGFLIGTILLQERDTKCAFNIKKFYCRRWLRIFPAYYFYLACMLGGSSLFGDHVVYWQGFALASLYLVNLDGAYSLKLAHVPSTLWHTWSLCVEEQFYALFPIALLLVKTRVLSFSISVIAFVYLWRIYLVAHGMHGLRLLWGFDTKIDSIMFGVMAAQVCRSDWFRCNGMRIAGGAKTQFALCSLLLIVCYGLGLVNEQPAYQSLMWGFLFPAVQWLMTMLLVSLYTNQETPLARVLSSKLMVAIGLLSYSLYLWQGVIVFPGMPDAINNLCGGNSLLMEISFYAINFALAAVSYLVIEKPFLRMKERFSATTKPFSGINHQTASK